MASTRYSFMNESLSACTALIRSFERPQCVARLVESIRQFYPDLRVIVGDDSFNPQPRSDVEWLSLGVDVGVSRGRNALLEAVQTPFFLMMDDDYIFHRHTRIESLMDVVSSGKADIATGQLQTPDGEWSRIFRFEIENTYMTATMLKPEPPRTVCDFGSVFFVANTEKVREAGGWDDEFSGGSEHPIFFVRMKYAGIKTVCVPDVWCDHVQDRKPHYLKYRGREQFNVSPNGKWVKCPPLWHRYDIHAIRKIYG
jgi:GT2 family glycosyltransferase